MHYAYLAGSVVVAGVVLSADYAWAAYRDWRVRRAAYKTGQTLTRKFSLPPQKLRARF
jgi:hypothetical protein